MHIKKTTPQTDSYFNWQYIIIIIIIIFDFKAYFPDMRGLDGANRNKSNEFN